MYCLKKGRVVAEFSNRRNLGTYVFTLSKWQYVAVGDYSGFYKGMFLRLNSRQYVALE